MQGAVETHNTIPANQLYSSPITGRGKGRGNRGIVSPVVLEMRVYEFGAELLKELKYQQTFFRFNDTSFQVKNKHQNYKINHSSQADL